MADNNIIFYFQVIRRRLIFNMKRYLKGIGALHLLTLHKQTQEPLLHLAVEEGRLDVVEVLIGRGEDPNVRGLWGTTPLHEAGAAGKTEMIQVSTIGYNNYLPIIVMWNCITKFVY